LAGALVLVFSRIIRMEEAYRAVEWNAVFLIAGMYPASIAIVQTGLAESIGHQLLLRFSGFGPLGLAGAAYLLSAILTQVMGGSVAVLVATPIAISAAIASHANPQAIAVAAAIGCSASFLTPISHPVNALVIAPANYRFNDFLRAGWPLMIISFVGVLLGMVLFWHL